MLRYGIPLALFLLLVGVFFVGLQKDPSIVPSPLIGKPVPSFELPQLKDPQQVLTDKDLHGEVVLLNVWASYCIPCQHEHPFLMQLANDDAINIYGLNYADDRNEAIDWLQRLGDPFIKSAFDEKRKVSIDFGVYGVPETYIIDSRGIIRYKHIGPISKDILDVEILPLIEQLKSPSA